MKRYTYIILSLLYGLPLLAGIIGLGDEPQDDIPAILAAGLVTLLLMQTLLYGGWILLVALALQRLARKSGKPLLHLLAKALRLPGIVFPLAWALGFAACCILPLWKLLGLNCSADASIGLFAMWTHIVYFALAIIIFAIGMAKHRTKGDIPS